jgi:Fe-S oxidoreductase
MSLPIKDILGILADNLKYRKGVIPLGQGKVNSWARGLDIPHGGETVLYTGQMYQLIPSINAMSTVMAKLENSWITRFIGLGRIANRIINLSWFMSLGAGKEQKTYDSALRNIAVLLKKAGVQFGYLYNKELYSGALVYDEGVDDVFTEHARRIYRIFKENSVKQVITVDPHTTNMLKAVYPRFIEGYDLIVRSYIEVLAESGLNCIKPLDLDLVIHDPCIYARHEGIVAQPRELLEKAGARIHVPELSGRLTHCCGGPLESLFPSTSHMLACNRISQLAECGSQIVTMCPICLSNLKRSAPATSDIQDLSKYLCAAYCVLD